MNLPVIQEIFTKYVFIMSQALFQALELQQQTT